MRQGLYEDRERGRPHSPFSLQLPTQCVALSQHGRVEKEGEKEKPIVEGVDRRRKYEVAELFFFNILNSFRG